MDVSSVKSKAGIVTGEFAVMVPLTRKNFMDIPNVLSTTDLSCGMSPTPPLVLRYCTTSFKILPRKEAGTTKPSSSVTEEVKW